MNRSGPRLRFAGLAMLALLLCSLWMMNQATYNPERFGRFYYPLLITSSGALICLLGLILIKLYELWKAYRRRAQGTRMTLRMVSYATLLVLAPVLIVYYFSLDFLQRGIDNWFNLQVEQALEDSLELSREALDIYMRNRVRETENIANELTPQDGVPLSLQIDEYRDRLGALELTLFHHGNGEIISSSSANLTELVPRLINESTLTRLRQENTVVELKPLANEALHIHVAVNVPSGALESGPYVAQALFPVPQRINELANSVQTAFGNYQTIAYLRIQLKLTFILILTLVLLFAVFGGLWGVFAVTDKLLAPIHYLVRGTEQVATGDYNIQLPITSRDELGFLVQSFNTMTARVAASRHDIEEQRTYLQSILEQISSGVMVCDRELRLRTWNDNLQKLLHIQLTPEHQGRTLDHLPTNADQTRTLGELDQCMRRHPGAWQEQLSLFGPAGNRILHCSGTTLSVLPEDGGPGPGHIIVIDDITELVYSQRHAAWGEVARRLAHEIKNPLTPIQLAAERLRHKYLPLITAPGEAAALKSLTATIENQVQAMRNMLDAFRQYASPPRIQTSDFDLNRLVKETTDLYQNIKPPPQIKLTLGELPQIHADRGKLTQVLNNLLSNALHADQRDGHGSTLQLQTRLIKEDNQQAVELSVRDQGTGISQELMKTMFEPYVTGHEKGTGLGLAIVKKIIDEHRGMIRIANNEPPPGACATIRLPIATDKPQALKA